MKSSECIFGANEGSLTWLFSKCKYGTPGSIRMMTSLWLPTPVCVSGECDGRLSIFFAMSGPIIGKINTEEIINIPKNERITRVVIPGLFQHKMTEIHPHAKTRL